MVNKIWEITYYLYNNNNNKKKFLLLVLELVQLYPALTPPTTKIMLKNIWKQKNTYTHNVYKTKIKEEKRGKTSGSFLSKPRFCVFSVLVLWLS